MSCVGWISSKGSVMVGGLTSSQDGTKRDQLMEVKVRDHIFGPEDSSNPALLDLKGGALAVFYTVNEGKSLCVKVNVNPFNINQWGPGNVVCLMPCLSQFSVPLQKMFCSPLNTQMRDSTIQIPC